LLAADRKKRHGFCKEKKPQKSRPFLRQLKQALALHFYKGFLPENLP
jgi:hypothetical protein